MRIAALGRLTPVAVLAALALAGCGGDEAGDRPDPFEAVERNEAASDQRVRAEAAPRWERVVTLRGTGEATETVTIDPGVIQWRVRWSCTEGRLQVTQPPASDESRPLVSEACPGEGRAEAIDAGERQLAVRSEGPWEVVVEQQVTEPLAEPPLPQMEAQDAEVVARGDFYEVDKRGSGRAILHELPSGRLALRLEGFSTFNNTDLFVWTSERRRPRTTQQALRSDHTEIALLKSTIGDQNYLLPEDTDADDIRSIVIWCEPVRIAYTAAALER
jgi:hypothetical protein